MKGIGAMGDTFNLTGDFRGAILNIKSTLREVRQSVGEIQSADQVQIKELQGLIEGLSRALEGTPPEMQDQAEAVAESARVLVESAKSEKPNKTMIRITGEGLKQAAQNLAEVAPTVISIASQIVLAVLKITGSQP
jgi:hypothetical protein